MSTLSIFSKKIIYIGFSLLFSFTACKKFVDVEAPITSYNSDIVYKNDATAIGVLNNIYTKISQAGIRSGLLGMSLYPGLSSDELEVVTGVDDPVLLSYYTNSLTPTNTGGSDFWIYTYSTIIFTANSAIDGLDNSDELSPEVKRQLLGEAKFIRAFCYFYLLNLYGSVPLPLSTDYKKNSTLDRTDIQTVYNQVITDLNEAKSLLSERYLDGTLLNSSIERISPTKWAACALLARVYLYLGNWEHAELEANEIIANQELYDTVSLDKVFLVNSKEAIWQLQSVSNFLTNTSEGQLFVLPSTGPNTYLNQVYLSTNLVHSFEQGDKRKDIWTDSVTANGTTYYFPYKYKESNILSPVVERSVIFRIGEIYLIRSEARARKGNLIGSLNDLSVIRKRAGLPTPELNSESEVLNLIIRERRVELFTEWGHRWLDLKRLGLASQILQPIKGSNWQDTDQLYPIPLSEITNNPTLKGEQNPGY